MDIDPKVVDTSTQIMSKLFEYSVSLFILLVVAAIFGFLYWTEKKTNRKLQEQLIAGEIKHSEQLRLVYEDSRNRLEATQKLTVEKVSELSMTTQRAVERSALVVDMVLNRGNAGSLTAKLLERSTVDSNGL